MRKFEMLGLALLGTFALGTLARADSPSKGEPSGQADQSPSWIARFFADDNQGPPWRVKAKKQKDRLEKEQLENEAAKKLTQKSSDRNKSNESDAKEAGKRQADLIKHEQAEYLRRLAVCDQLREVALKNNDESLNRQADDLQAQAWAVYSKHIASFSGSKISGSRNGSRADVTLSVDSELGDATPKEEKP